MRQTDAIEPPPLWLLLVAAVAVLALVVGAGVFAFRASSPAQAAEPVAAAHAAAETDRESLVAAIKEDPANLAARLQLAHDDFDASEYHLALEQYMAVLEQRPGHARSLARSGWIAFEGGDNRTAERLVGESLEAASDDAEALWFLRHIRLYSRLRIHKAPPCADRRSGARRPQRHLPKFKWRYCSTAPAGGTRAS